MKTPFSTVLIVLRDTLMSSASSAWVSPACWRYLFKHTTKRAVIRLVRARQRSSSGPTAQFQGQAPNTRTPRQHLPFPLKRHQARAKKQQAQPHSWSAPFISNSQVIICLTGVTRAALKDVRLTDNTLLMPMHNDSVQR